MNSAFDARPIIVAIAGPNGAGKSTFFEAHLASAGLRFLNADDLARELALEGVTAAELANRLRVELVNQGESFVFETVLLDPVGDKVDFLAKTATQGYTVVLIFIGLDDASISEQRVAMRAMQGGHDVPAEKLSSRFPRTMKNLRRAIRKLPHVLVFDNSDLADPFRKVAEFENGEPVLLNEPLPRWLPLTNKRRRGGRR
ncbi:MAG TPA: zeta toxin family protein [Myxococcales bacterium]|nr:zeta toxin family protein [Myxococcales bacterium]